jgi:hypothetical protein
VRPIFVDENVYRFCPFQVENFHRELPRDLIATGMVRELILAWARGRGMSD